MKITPSEQTIDLTATELAHLLPSKGVSLSRRKIEATLLIQVLSRAGVAKRVAIRKSTPKGGLPPIVWRIPKWVKLDLS